MNVVYVLSDPRTNQIRYVGKTTKGKKRLRGHLKERGRSKRSSWIKSLRLQAYKPQFDVIESFDNESLLSEAEMFWISYFKMIGCNLTNMTDGGEGSTGFKHSVEVIEILRKKSTGKTVPKEVRKKMSDSHIGLQVGSKNPMFGKLGTMLGRKGSLHPTFGLKFPDSNVKEVYCVTDNLRFKSTKIAAAFYGVPAGSIAGACRKEKLYMGKLFMYSKKMS